jgi:hypothetical protein
MIGESGCVESGPKPVARTSEVMTDRRGVKAGINPAEKNAEATRDYIRDRLSFRGKKLLPSWLPGLSQGYLLLDLEASLL